MTTKKQDRYFVDERIGCIAVRDRQHPEHDVDYPGLDSSTPDVVWYKHGYMVNGVWKVSAADVIRAYDIEYDLNRDAQQEDKDVLTDDELYDSVYMEVVQLVEKDNIECGMYLDTVKKLQQHFIITKREVPHA